MAKRFIDTGIFDDDWFMDLSKDAKILWLYFITKCDHAGILKLNTKLCQVQTGIKDLDTVRQQLGNRCITVSEQLFFIPKFVEYQYPGFPNCKFQMAKSAITILEKYGLIKDSQLTVAKESPDSYGNGNGNGNGNGIGNGVDYGFVIENYHSLCQKLNKVEVLNDLRKGFVNARVGEFGMDKVISVLRIAGESDFLNGKNDKAWKADFEWIMRPTNFIKIMEGKYNNKDKKSSKINDYELTESDFS